MHPGRALVAVLCAGALSGCASTAGVSRPASAAPGGKPAPAQAVVHSAVSLIGTPYRFGGTTPQAGFDCSGLVAYVMGLHAVLMPRSVSGQYHEGRSVTRDHLKPGDLVFFTTTGPGATHVGIVTDAAQGQFVHAPSDGSRVRVDRLDNEYWHKRWIGARRVL